MNIHSLADKLRERQPLAPLCPRTPWNGELSQTLQQTDEQELFGTATDSLEQGEMRAACRAALLLWNDDLDASHTIAQGIETSTGSAWHAIMHRREGDFSNSKYWWRRAGEHPALGEIQGAVASTLQKEENEAVQSFRLKLEQAGTWLPMEFVDLCASAESTHADSDWLQRVQQAEIETLFEWCRART